MTRPAETSAQAFDRLCAERDSLRTLERAAMRRYDQAADGIALSSARRELAEIAGQVRANEDAIDAASEAYLAHADD